MTVNGHPIIDNIGQDEETKWIFTVPANPDPTLTWEVFISPVTHLNLRLSVAISCNC